MKYFWKALLILLFSTRMSLGETGHKEDHGGHSGHSSTQAEEVVRLRLNQGELKAGNVTLSFALVSPQTEASLSDRELDVSHEKKLHMFVFDTSLNEYRHIHPEYRQGKWVVDTTLPSGKYRAWVQGKTKPKGKDFTASDRLTIVGAGSAKDKAPNLTELRSGTDGTSKVVLSSTRLRPGEAVELNVTLSRTDGTSPSITPYLGAKAHVVAVPEKGDSLLHVHPMDHGKQNELVLHTMFPTAGLYRIWVEFLDAGKLRVVPLAVKVGLAI